MKFKQKKTSKSSLSDKIADALTLKPRADIEDDQVFGTKPQTVSRADFSSSESEDETAISDFRKRNVHLLSDVSKKYEGQVVSRKDLEKHSDGSSVESDTENGDISASDKKLADDREGSSSEQSDTSDPVKKLSRLFAQSNSDDSDSSNKGSGLRKKPIKANCKQKFVSDSDDVESGSESDDYSITKFKKQLENDDSEFKESGDDDEDDEEGEEEGYDISQMDEPPKEEFQHVKKQNVSEEAKKGACVRNQLLVWEGLLEMRIHLQRCMNTANQMPMPETCKQLKNNSDFVQECKTTTENVTNVLDKFLALQNELFKKFPETKNIPSKHSKQTANTKEESKVESDEEIPSDTDNEEIPSETDEEANDAEKEEKPPSKSVSKTVTRKRKTEDYEKDIAMTHKAFKPFMDSTIQKWNEKTRLATATNMKHAPTNTILQQISYILSDREKLVRRTQLKRSEYDIIGHKKTVEEGNVEQNGTELNPGTRDRKDNDEYIPEIFDDSDFYHQLLRELIECKSADISDPVQLSRQWIALQQMRSKMKRRVDTKATKGRKIKYVVHNKLVNFMASEKSTTWTDDSTNELYSSLFGKMFEQNNVGISENLSNLFKLN